MTYKAKFRFEPFTTKTAAKMLVVRV